MVSHEPILSPWVLGEILYDCFPDGRDILGGAPFNVAWHLQGFALSPRLVTRVGNDVQGLRARSFMSEWGMDTRWVQTDPDRATGRVAVRIVDGEPSFSIAPAQAFDRIAPPERDAAPAGSSALLYHGTLALREAPDSLLDDLRGRCGAVFFDVNLRAPWWDRGRVGELMDGADWVKMNVHEMAELVPDGDAAALCARHGLKGVIVTDGAERAFWATSAGVVAATRPPAVTDLVDTVGAGDAFSAVCITGLVHGWPPGATLERAAEFAADICRRRGATAAAPELYDRSWDREPAPLEEGR